jgi:transposase
MATAPWVVSDELWEMVEPILPVNERRFRYPGRKRLPDRQALQGILFVLHTGMSWTHLPLEHGRARAGLTEPETAPNTISSSKAAASRSPGRSPPATATTAPS